MKIRSWEKQIRRMDKRHNQLIAIANHLALFSGVNVKNSIGYTSSKYRQIRGLFSKYCLENGISATLVAEYIGASRGDIVSASRKAFTRSFEKKPMNRELFNRFKLYIEDIDSQEETI